MLRMNEKKQIYVKCFRWSVQCVHNIISVSRHEQVHLMGLRFEKYFSITGLAVIITKRKSYMIN